MTYLPRFHPMIATYNGRKGWWIMDSCVGYNRHGLMLPYADEPCETHAEALEICDMLNATEPDPREERDAKSRRNRNRGSGEGDSVELPSPSERDGEGDLQ